MKTGNFSSSVEQIFHERFELGTSLDWPNWSMYQPSLDTLLIEETTNQTKSQQIDQFFLYFGERGKTAVYPGKSLSEPSSEPINSVQI